VWQDVITVPAGVVCQRPGGARQGPDCYQFVDFTGTYMLHCHILAREGRDMMQLVRLVEAEIPSLLPDYIPEHH
jgi:FtsP/CotA-like multicopper oxidase with cupredoxin domain